MLNGRVDPDRARSALFAIDAGGPRDEWVRLGMSAKSAGLTFDDFLAWSERAPNYSGEADCRCVWRSFEASGGIGAGTLFARAREAGWQDERPRMNGHARAQEPRQASDKGSGSSFDFAAAWRDSEPATAAHAYVQRKLGLPAGLRVYHGPLRIAGQPIDGALLVPAFDTDGALQSWQAIPASEGKKLNAPGASMAGGRFIVGGPLREGAPCYIVEGVGAAWSANQATGKPAAVCFGSGNVERVAVDLHAKHPAVRLVIVADRGKEADSERIARIVGGAWVALPETWPANSDINDLHVRDGLQAVEDLLRQTSAPAADPAADPAPDAWDAPAEIDLGTLAATVPTPPVFIIPGWLPAGEITLLAANGGTGKSLTGLQAAVCLALGLDFHGIAVQQRAVDFLSFEDSTPVLHWRLDRVCEALGVEMSALIGRLRIFDGTLCGSAWYSKGQYNETGPTAAFHDISERIGGPGRVVIVDGSSDTFAGDENNRAQVKAFIRLLRRLIAADGALVLLAHVDKQSARAGAESLGFSGSTGWSNSVRARWFMFHEADENGAETGNVVAEVRKSNLGRSGARMVLRFDETSGVFQRVDAEPTQAGTFHRVDESDAILRAIREASAAGNPIPAATAGVRTAHSVCEARDDLPAALRGRRGRTRFYRLLEQLRAAGAVRVEAVKRPNRHAAEVLCTRD